MPAHNGKRGASGNDAGANDFALRRAAPEHKCRILRRTGFAHRCETSPYRQRCVFDAHHHAPFIGIDRLVPEITAGVAG